MDETPPIRLEASLDAIRPTQGGSYVRLPDGALVPEADWLAAQGQPMGEAATTTSEPVGTTVETPALTGRRKKEG